MGVSIACSGFKPEYLSREKALAIAIASARLARLGLHLASAPPNSVRSRGNFRAGIRQRSIRLS
nr:MAG TPA: hypothetical protein [Caudoviricetes sp.]